MQGVATHEIGHALGFRHSFDSKSVMVAWYNGYRIGNNLPDYDLKLLHEKYGKYEYLRKNKYINKFLIESTLVGARKDFVPRKTTIPTPSPQPKYIIPSTTKNYNKFVQPNRDQPQRVEPEVPVIINNLPDACNTDYDAIALVRGETLIFKDGVSLSAILLSFSPFYTPPPPYPKKK